MEKSHKIIFRDGYFWLSFLLGGFFIGLTLWYSFGMDQSIYSYGAWVWKHYHLPPYVGAWDLNFPGIFFIHRAAMELFGESILGFRIFDFLVQLTCLAMVFYLSRRLSGSSPAGFISGVFYGIYYFDLGNYNTGQREGYVFWLLLAAVVLSLVLENRRRLRACLAGLLVGFAFLIKPFFGLAWPIFGIWFLWEGTGNRPKRAFLALALFSICCLVPSGVTIIYYWRLGHVQELFQATLWYNFEIYSAPGVAGPSHPWWYDPVFVITSITWKSWVVFPALLGAMMRLKTRDPNSDRLFWVLIFLGLAGFAAYYLQGKFFPYQLIPLMGFLIIFAGPGWAGVATRLQAESLENRVGRFEPIIYALAVLLMLVSVRFDLQSFALKYCFRNLDRAYGAWLNSPADTHYSSNNYLAAKKLSSLSGVGDEIEYFGPYPLIPFLLKKKLPSRFVCVQHLIFLPRSGKMTGLQKKWIEEYTDAVIQARPRFFLVSEVFPGQTYKFFNLASSSLTGALHDQFPALQGFLLENYKLSSQEGVIAIYELKKPAPGTPAGGGATRTR